MNEYVSDIAIDFSKLDEEWLGQAPLFQHYAELKAEADKKKTELKEELDVLKAQVELAYRKGDRDVGSLKITESTISALVTSDEEVMKKSGELREAVYEANVLGSVVESCVHRKKALEKLVDLFVFGYFGEPKEGRVDQIREMKKQRRELNES